MPGADLDPPVLVGVGHDQKLVGAAQVNLRGELKMVAMHAISAWSRFAGTRPSVVIDAVAGDPHQGLNFQPVQRVSKSRDRITLIQNEQWCGTARRTISLAEPFCQVANLIGGRHDRAGSLGQATSIQWLSPR